jgi:cytoskeleton protein RodZ
MVEAGGEAVPARTAGAMLREARQAQGVHIAALSASIKVAQRKLEALEADRFDELPDATFTRALAQTVCRALKIDAAPVLALLPAPVGHRLEQVAEGINQPFRDKPGRHEPKDLSVLASPAVWGPVLLLLAAVAVYLMPQGWLATLQPTASEPVAGSQLGTVSVVVPNAAPAGAEAAAPGLPAANVPDQPSEQADATPDPAPAAPAQPAAPAASVAVAVPVNAPLELRASAQSWIEVHDGRSRLLLSRLVEPGESVVLDGALPLRLKIGNAQATEVVFRGRSLDLAPSTRDNVARLELK